MNASDCDILLETQLSSHDPVAPARLFTVLQGLLTPTAQRSPRNVVYLHRGINPSKRLFFQALCAALGKSNTSYRSGCGWVTSESIDDATRILNSGATGRYPQLLVLDGIPSGSLVEWRHLMSLAATPAVQIHILQDIAWPHEPLRLPTALVEQYDWRDLSSAAVSLRADAVDVLAPAIAAWLGIVGGAHPPDTHLCAEVVAAPTIVPATPETPPSARSPRRGLLGATPALWSLGGACASGPKSIITDEPRPVLPLGTHVPPPSPCRESPCMAAARSAPAEEHAMCGDRAFRVVQAPTSNALPPGVGDAPSTASSADTTPIGQAPSVVSPSAATWPQESQSAATATQPGSTRSSAETVQPTGAEAGDFIVIHDVKLPLAQVVADLKADGSGVVKIKLRLFADESNDWWENYRCVKARLMEHRLQEHAIVPVEHTSLSLVGVTSLVFTKLGAPVRAQAGFEVDLEGVPPRKEATKRASPRPLAAMQERAAATAVYPGAGTGDSGARYYTALALAGEAGEVAGKASKVLRDGESSALMAALYAELGDVLWHWLQCCAEWGAQPDQVAEAMFARLQDRQARGKLRGSGDER